MRESGERRLLYDARRRDADAGRELSAALLSLRSQRLSVSVNPCGRCDSGVTVMLEMPLQRVLQILAAFRIPDLVDLHDKPLFVIRSGFLFLFFICIEIKIKINLLCFTLLSFQTYLYFV